MMCLLQLPFTKCSTWMQHRQPPTTPNTSTTEKRLATTRRSAARHTPTSLTTFGRNAKTSSGTSIYDSTYFTYRSCPRDQTSSWDLHSVLPRSCQAGEVPGRWQNAIFMPCACHVQQLAVRDWFELLEEQYQLMSTLEGVAAALETRDQYLPGGGWLYPLVGCFFSRNIFFSEDILK